MQGIGNRYCLFIICVHTSREMIFMLFARPAMTNANSEIWASPKAAIPATAGCCPNPRNKIKNPAINLMHTKAVEVFLIARDSERETTEISKF